MENDLISLITMFLFIFSSFYLYYTYKKNEYEYKCEHEIEIKDIGVSTFATICKKCGKTGIYVCEGLHSGSYNS